MIGQHLGQRFAGARGLVQQRVHPVFRHVAQGRAKPADKQPGFDKLVSVKVHAGTMADGSSAGRALLRLCGVGIPFGRASGFLL